MRAREAICTALDFETTGSVSGYRNEPWQIGLVELQRGMIAPGTTVASLLRVDERPFNPHAPGRHGELRSELAAAPTLTSLWSRLHPRLVGRPLIAHNVSTEKRMLGDCFPLHHFGPWIDTLALSRYAFPHHLLESQCHVWPLCTGWKASVTLGAWNVGPRGARRRRPLRSTGAPSCSYSWVSIL